MKTIVCKYYALEKLHSEPILASIFLIWRNLSYLINILSGYYQERYIIIYEEKQKDINIFAFDGCCVFGF